MPWQKPAHRVIRLSIRGIGTHFEKLEDRVAIAATATLAAGGIIFDGAAQLFASNEAPLLPRSSGSGGSPPSPPTQHGKTAPHNKGKRAGGGRGASHWPWSSRD